MAEPRFKIRCQQCSKTYAVNAELAGKNVKCSCGARLRIPPTPAPPTAEALSSREDFKFDLNDDEYDVEPPIERSTSLPIRQSVETSVQPRASQRDLSGGPTRTPPPRPAPGPGTSSGRPSLMVLLLLFGIVLELILTGLFIWMSVGLSRSAEAIVAGGRAHPGPPRMSPQEDLARLSEAWSMWSTCYMVLATVVAVLYLTWIYRAHRRLKPLGASNLRFTPGWAVGYHFVPFWNLIRPYQIVREIWHGSDPRGPLPNDCGKSLVRAGELVPLWWATFLISGFFGVYAFMSAAGASAHLGRNPGIGQVALATIKEAQMYQAALILVMFERFLLAMLAWTIERRQIARAQLVSNTET